MKKTFKVELKNIILLILLGCLFLFNLSCGLDTFEVFESPEVTIGAIPEASRQDVSYADAHFEFYTNEPSVPYSTIKYLGTDVYYKIYNSINQLETEVQRLNSIATSTENSSYSFSQMAEAGGYGYTRLLAEGYETNEVLIPSKGRNQRVFIRLTDYLDINEYAARILIDGNNYNSSTKNVRPIRFISESNNPVSFNFGRYSDEIIGGRSVYNGTDADVKNSSDSTVVNNEWYVAMFAVAVARDINFSHQYSNILYLGNIKINANDKNN